jgi:hypothetical protein
MSEKMVQMGRLAMREEGSLWVAYYAPPDNMTDAIFLGSIRLAFVQQKDRKDLFMALMKEAVSDIMEEALGHRPTWPSPPQPAPEHERGGKA